MTVHDEIRRYLDPGVLEAGATVITVNNRLSRRLHHLWSARMRDQRREVWETPDILPWNAWLRRGWEHLLMAGLGADESSPGMLLSTQQELACWEQIIADSAAGGELLQPVATAHRVREARGLAAAWRVEWSIEEPGISREVAAFHQWSARFDARCRERDWIDEASLPGLLAARIAGGTLPPADLWLIGFDELTPQQQALIEAIETAGGRVTHALPPDANGTATRLALPDADAEILAAARWARAALQRRPDSRIGVVVPDLAARRSSVAAVFEDILRPDAVLPDHRESVSETVFNLSAGDPLAHCAVVYDALRAFDLAREQIPLDVAGALLRSPFVTGAEQELSARAMLDVRLREKGIESLALERWIEAATDPCPLLAGSLSRLHEDIVKWRRRALRPSDWAERLLGWLRILGWPGERALDSDEYQAVEAWRGLVTDLSGLDSIHPSLTFEEVLARLHRLGAETMFQPERPETPVQVLGMLEAGGQYFDHLWVTGLHDEVWPPASDPNPFLPLDRQRQLGLPRSSAEREFAVAERLTGRLIAAAPEVRVSHPLQEGDRDLRPSPLIEALPQTASPPADDDRFPLYRDVIHQAGRMPGCVESLIDVTGPPLTGDRATGGSRLFKLHAECPFRAFASLRLKARPLEEPEAGLDAVERGNLLHRVLETLWRELSSQEALQSLDPESLDALIARHVGRAVDAAAAERPGVFTERFRALEQQRLARRLHEWLEIEKKRAPFTVEATEYQMSVSTGGLDVDVRIDRIDRLEDGGRVILDYKTGDVKVGQWFGERPEEPQLPLYSLAQDAELAAVLFARLRPGETACIGIARSEGIAPEVKTLDQIRGTPAGDWADLIAAWRESLTRLAEAFRAGEARVDPRDGDQTCGRCGLHALCRIHDSSGSSDKHLGGRG